MSRDLYGRLKQLKRAAAGRPPEPPRASAAQTPGTGETPPEGWRVAAPHVFEREMIEPLAGQRFAAPPVDGDAMFECRTLGRRVDVRTLRFMDTETTGLSGGAGTVVFLAGSARLTEDGLRVRQTLLGDFPAEPDFLRQIAADLGAGVWVSYNGKAFDARLLESRFLMHGRPPLSTEHVDLLPWSRRLWRRRIGPCALSDVERKVLDRPRIADVPGIEIPERYFRSLRAGEFVELEPVFEHHYRDMVSLVHLFFRIEAVLASPLEDESVDPYRLGRLLLSRGDASGLELLEREVRTGEEAAHRAAILLSRAHRRAGRPAEAIRVLTACSSGHAETIAVELAKIHEHDLRDPAEALRVLTEFLHRDGSREPSDPLAYRLARLSRKAGVSASADRSAASGSESPLVD